MIYLILGHRGVGKSLWLKKIRRILKKNPKTPTLLKDHFLDLDLEIEKKTSQKISDFFSLNKTGASLNLAKQEKTFRKLEKKILMELINKYKDQNRRVFIALGAGYKQKPPSFCHVIHLIRETDISGRVFLDRPRLSKSKSPYKEYTLLYPKRESFYKSIRDESLVLPEWDFTFDEPEKLLFSLKTSKLNSIITLNRNSLPSHLKKWPDFIKKRISLGISFFELRDDELNSEELSFLLKIIPKKKQLLSFRKPSSSFFLNLKSLKDKSLKNKGLKEKKTFPVFDWPLEKGKAPAFPHILSLHERKKEPLNRLLKKLLQHKAQHFKLALPIYSLKELMQGHLWFLEDPKHRSFLPVSPDGEIPGRWRWYRQIFGPQMKLNFIRESRGGLADQPFLYEHLLSLNKTSLKPQNKKTLFAAVLGDPIAHSRSPTFHREFFKKYGIVFVKIPLKEEEFSRENLCILQKMGLVFSAVTSPLKKKAFKISDKVDSSVRNFESVNTLILKNQEWIGYNTDQYGLRELLKLERIKKKKFPETDYKALGKKDKLKPLAIWGGGGVKKLLEAELPFADFYSARTGKKQSSKTSTNKSPKVLIWALGRDRMPTSLFPNPAWKPRLVLDLNYREDSPGLEYALKVGAEYISGKTFFLKQAKKQQSLFLKQYPLNQFKEK